MSVRKITIIVMTLVIILIGTLMFIKPKPVDNNDYFGVNATDYLTLDELDGFDIEIDHYGNPNSMNGFYIKITNVEFDMSVVTYRSAFTFGTQKNSENIIDHMRFFNRVGENNSSLWVLPVNDAIYREYRSSEGMSYVALGDDTMQLHPSSDSELIDQLERIEVTRQVHEEEILTSYPEQVYVEDELPNIFINISYKDGNNSNVNLFVKISSSQYN